MNKFLKLLMISLPLILTACASNQQINFMADHRASLLKSKLPMQYGPLNITDARADENVVEILMIYNQGTAITPEDIINGGVNAYCNSGETRSVIEQGVVYRIIMRDERGSLLSDTRITDEVCDSLDN